MKLNSTENGRNGGGHAPPVTIRTENAQEHVNIFMRLQVGLYDHGYDRAVSSGALEPEEIVIQALKEHATAMAEETYQRAFDPLANIDDKYREEDYQRNLKELNELILGIKHAKAEFNRREDESARLKTQVPKEPEFPVFAACFGTSVIALTVAPTFHDTVFASFGNDAAWGFGLLTGMVWGGFVTYSILDGGRDSDKQNWMNFAGLIAAMGMGVALGLIRLLNAVDFTDYLSAIGFSLLEIFVALELDTVGRKYHARYAEFAEKSTAAGQLDGLAASAKKALDGRISDSEKLEEKVRNYRTYVSERELRANHKSELIASAVKAVLDGYDAGIRHNKGKILGINFREAKL